MDRLTVHEQPNKKLRTMVVSFAGWPDASESATWAVKYLIRKLSARKFAEIDPEDFYDFTLVRPQTRLNDRGEREIHWPGNDFYYHPPGDASQGLVLYVGTEPNLKWRAFSDILVDVASRYGVEAVFSVGALMDAVPHTRETRVSGRASSPALVRKAEDVGIGESGYQGPIGIHTSFMDACIKNGLDHASIWGHSPHYLTTSPNVAVSYALLRKLLTLTDIRLDLAELRGASVAYEKKATEAISRQDDVQAYVRRLEERHDATAGPTEPIPSPDAMVADLEEFLRSQREQKGDGERGEG